MASAPAEPPPSGSMSSPTVATPAPRAWSTPSRPIPGGRRSRQRRPSRGGSSPINLDFGAFADSFAAGMRSTDTGRGITPDSTYVPVRTLRVDAPDLSFRGPRPDTSIPDFSRLSSGIRATSLVEPEGLSPSGIVPGLQPITSAHGARASARGPGLGRVAAIAGAGVALIAFLRRKRRPKGAIA